MNEATIVLLVLLAGAVGVWTAILIAAAGPGPGRNIKRRSETGTASVGRGASLWDRR